MVSLHWEQYIYFFAAEKIKKSQEGRQLTMTLILVCVAFLVLATPLYSLIALFTFMDAMANPKRFAVFTLIKNIFEQVCEYLCSTKYLTTAFNKYC